MCSHLIISVARVGHTVEPPRLLILRLKMNATSESGGWWRAPLFTERGWRASAVPYFQACLAFVTLVYLFETYLDLRCVLLASTLSR